MNSLRARPVGRIPGTRPAKERSRRTYSYPYAEFGITEFIPSPILCRAFLKPEISGDSGWKARNSLNALEDWVRRTLPR